MAKDDKGLLGRLVRELSGARRNRVPVSGIDYKVATSAERVVPGAITHLYSGQEPPGARPVGARNRHPKGFAGDFYFTDPAGRMVTNPVALQDIAMDMAARHNANIGYDSVNYMGPGRMHIDTMPLNVFSGGAQWGATAKGWAPNLQFARETGIGPTPFANAPTPFGAGQQNPNTLIASAEDGPQIASASPVPTTGAAWAATQPSQTAPYANVGFPGMDGVQRAPLGPVSRPAPAMPSSASLTPTKPTLSIGPTTENFAQPSTADLAAAYGKMGADMQSVGVNRLGMMPAPNSPVAMPPEITQPNQSVPQALPNSAGLLPNSANFPPQPSVPRSMPSSLTPTAPRGDPFGSVASQDNFGNSLVTNQYGVTTATMPDGKQAAYGKGTAGPLGRTSLLGNVGMPKGAPGLVGGLLGAAIGSALLGPVGGVIGGFAGKSLIGGGLGGGGFPAAPGTFGESKGKALSKSERSDISPAASRSMDRNGGKMTGLW